MFILRGTLSVFLSVALTTAVLAAPNQPRMRRANTGRGIEGTVVQIHHHRSPRGAGWIKVRRVATHRSGQRGGIGAAAALGRVRSRCRGNLMTVHVTRSTRFARLGRTANGQSSNRRTSFAALRHGERVRIVSGSVTGRQQAARVVNIVSYGSGARRSTNRARYANYGRYSGHRRHSLVGNSLGSQSGGRRYYSNRPRVTVIRPVVRHTLIVNRVVRRSPTPARHTVAHHTGTKTVKTTHTTHHTTPPKHTPAKPPAHKPTAMHTKHMPAHSAGHSKPHSSSHRKR